ncbi:MAG: ATP-dependent DNA helicase RecG, partial [Venatoribacter sp.]
MAKITKLTDLKGVGASFVEKLAKLQITSLADLFFHLPFRYEDRSRITPIGALQPMIPAVIQGEVKGMSVNYGKRMSMLVKVQDRTGLVSLRFYAFNKAQQSQFKTGTFVRCYGEPRPGASGLELYHPEYKILDDEFAAPLEPTLTPVYPTTDGITQQRIRLLHDQATEFLRNDQVDLIDLLPNSWLQQWQLPSLKEALLFLHHPPRQAHLESLEQAQHPAQRRLILEELLAHQLSLHRIRAQIQHDQAPAVATGSALKAALLASLPFQPTQAQLRVTNEIEADMAQPYPMLRLVQGDVGSGKTLVAALAACNALASGLQVALMAPTEILAEQHLDGMNEWFAPLGIQVGWLAGKVKGKARERALNDIATGQVQLVVGTHALFQDEVQFANLGLIIIDEQHRFGVHQRLSLREKGARNRLSPHQLVMTATPIPRTLAMSAYADLDTSIIDELPPGRSPIDTVAMADNRRPEVVERVHHACSSGAQAYWVCTLIEESETLQCQAAEDTAAELQAALPDLRIGLVHGRLKASEKADIMARFKAHELDLLVATTVIEVGVNVP